MEAQRKSENDHQMTTILGLAFGNGPDFTDDNPLGAVVDVLACGTQGTPLTFSVHCQSGAYRPDPSLLITTDASDGQAIRAADVPTFDLNAIIEAAESFLDHNIRVESTQYTTSKEHVCVIETPVNFRIRIDQTNSNVPRLSDAGRLVGKAHDTPEAAMNDLVFRLRRARVRSDWPFQSEQKLVGKLT